MWDTWEKAPLTAKIRFVVAMIIAFGVLVGALLFLTKQEGLVAAVIGMLAGIPAIMFTLKQHNKAEKEANSDQRNK